MNFIVWVIFAFAVLQVDSRALLEQEQDRFEIEERCVKELGLDREEMRQVVDNPKSPEEDKNHGKFFVCIWKKRGVMNEDGSISSKGLQRFFENINPNPDERYLTNTEKITEQCHDVQGLTPGQTGIKLKNCIMAVGSALSTLPI